MEQAQISDEDYQASIPTAPVLLSDDGIPVDISAPLLENELTIGGDF